VLSEAVVRATKEMLQDGAAGSGKEDAGDRARRGGEEKDGRGRLNMGYMNVVGRKGAEDEVRLG